MKLHSHRQLFRSSKLREKYRDARANVRLLLELEAVRVAENDFGKGGTASRVVDDLLDDTAGVSVAFRIIEGSELSRVLEANRQHAAKCWIGLLVRKKEHAFLSRVLEAMKSHVRYLGRTNLECKKVLWGVEAY